MNCPEYEERIALLVDGELERGAAWAVEKHLRTCGECAEFASQMEFDRELLRMPPPECSDVDFIALRHAIRRRISQEHPRAKWMPVLAMAGSILLIMAVAWLGRPNVARTLVSAASRLVSTRSGPPAKSLPAHQLSGLAAAPVLTVVGPRRITPRRTANRPAAAPQPRPDPDLEAALRDFLAKEITPAFPDSAVSPVAIRIQTSNPNVVLILLPESSGGFE